MDGTRIIRLLDVRPDLKMTGIEVDRNLAEQSRENLLKAKKDTEIIHGDITKSFESGTFECVICLNNTLGYIEEQEEALRNMKEHGRHVIVSVYGERFDDTIAEEYFSSLGLTISEHRGTTFTLEDFGNVRTYTKEDVEKWQGVITETPMGYFCEIDCS